MEKLVAAEELTRVARTALALRAIAVEDAGYPESLEIIRSLGLPPAEAERVTYTHLPDGSMRLQLASGRIVTEAASRERPVLRPLLTWELLGEVPTRLLAGNVRTPGALCTPRGAPGR